MTIELNSEDVAKAVGEYAIRKLGGSGKYNAEVALKCDVGKGGNNFSASVTVNVINGERIEGSK